MGRRPSFRGHRGPIIIRHDGRWDEGKRISSQHVSAFTKVPLLSLRPRIPPTPCFGRTAGFKVPAVPIHPESYFPRPLEVTFTIPPPSRCWRRVHVETLRPRCPDVGATFSPLSCDDDHGGGNIMARPSERPGLRGEPAASEGRPSVRKPDQ